jgi:hypothetical protein
MKILQERRVTNVRIHEPPMMNSNRNLAVTIKIFSVKKYHVINIGQVIPRG